MRLHSVTLLFTMSYLLFACTKAPAPSVKTQRVAEKGTARQVASLDTAVVATNSGLMRVGLKGNDAKLLVPGQVSWCAVDNRSQVIWALIDDSLKYLDLLSQETVTIVSGTPAVDTVIISHGKYGSLKGRNSRTYTTAIEIDIPTGSLNHRISCDGDKSYACFEEGAKPSGRVTTPRGDVYTKQLGNTILALRQLKLKNLGQISSINKRAAQRILWSKNLGKVSKRIVQGVDQGACEIIPEACGEGRQLDGTPYWLVTTANSRGDYFHEDKQLYDPKTKRFFNPRTKNSTSKSPIEEGANLEDVYVSPSGKGIVAGGKVIRFGHGVVYDKGEHACGWIGGGWFIP
jgi:hypothetical protein